MSGGTVKSAPGFSPAIDAEFVGVGNDYIHADPDGKHLRLNAHGVIKWVEYIGIPLSQSIADLHSYRTKDDAVRPFTIWFLSTCNQGREN